MEANPRPLVSIGLPVYNGEKFIEAALASLLAQDYPHCELIISDNASTDRTESICRGYAARDARIRYVRNAQNLGPLYNYNHLVDLAEGEFFMWAADDDVWEPAFISTLVSLLQTSPGAVLAFCDLDKIDAAGRSIMDLSHLNAAFPSGSLLQRVHRYIWLPEHEKSNIIYGLMRTATLRHIGSVQPRPGMDANLGLDYLYILQLILEGDFVASDRLLFHKRYKGARAINAAPSELVVMRRSYAHIIWRSKKNILVRMVLFISAGVMALSYEAIPLYERLLGKISKFLPEL